MGDFFAVSCTLVPLRAAGRLAVTGMVNLLPAASEIRHRLFQRQLSMQLIADWRFGQHPTCSAEVGAIARQ
jgi:hypothetical protein